MLTNGGQRFYISFYLACAINNLKERQISFCSSSVCKSSNVRLLCGQNV